MATDRSVHIGYNPPSSDRRLTAEPMPVTTFATDLERAVGIAVSSGLDSVWISDHLMSGDRFRLEAWTMLTWLASHFPGIPMGTSVLADAFRHPPLLAKMVATVTALSGSRVILGYGAGWDEPEYRAFGYDFLPIRERVDRMDESLGVLRALWQGGPVDHHGPSLRLDGAYGIPVPDPPPLVMVGGTGRRTIDVAVRRADWWNMPNRAAGVEEPLARVDEACARHGRDPGSLRRSIYLTAYLRPDAADARRLAGSRLQAEVPPFAGSPGQLVDYLGALLARGIDAFLMVFPDFPGTGDMELFIDQVLPAFRP